MPGNGGHAWAHTFDAFVFATISRSCPLPKGHTPSRLLAETSLTVSPWLPPQVAVRGVICYFLHTGIVWCSALDGLGPNGEKPWGLTPCNSRSSLSLEIGYLSLPRELALKSEAARPDRTGRVTLSSTLNGE